MAITNIETEGGTLAVEVEGEGPLVVCAPAMGDVRDAYEPLAAQLVKEGYTVARMDVRGHGESSANFKRYGDEATAEDFITIVEKLSMGPAVLAGASFSGGAATIAAGRRPDLVVGLILLGPCLRLGNVMMFHIMQVFFWKPWGPTFWQYFAKTLWPGLKGKESERAAASKASLTRPGRWPAFQATVAGLDHRVVGPWIEKASAKPALVVMGDKDPDWSKPLEEAKWVASNFQDAKIVEVPGCGHAPMLEDPEMVGRNVLEYLNRLRSKEAFANPRTIGGAWS